MPNFDVNSAVSFLKGYLSEQERQKAEKKIQKAMESGDWDITQQIDPMSGKQVYQLKTKETLTPFQQEQINILKRMYPEPTNQPSEPAESDLPEQSWVYQRIAGVPVRVPAPPGKESPTKETMRLSRQTLGQTITKMENLLNEIPSKEGIEGRLSGIQQRTKAWAGYNPKLQVYNQFKQAVLGQVTKVIGGETGSRLSDQDVKRMAGAFPSEFSTTSERQLQWDTFKSMVNDIAVTYGAKPLFGTQTSDPLEGKTATNPKTGQKLIRKDGQWIPM